MADAAASMAYRGLRGWIDTVDRLGELRRVSGAHWDVEMGAITHMLTEKSGGTAPAILFDDVTGYRKGFRIIQGFPDEVQRRGHQAVRQRMGMAGRQQEWRAAVNEHAKSG